MKFIDGISKASENSKGEQPAAPPNSAATASVEMETIEQMKNQAFQLGKIGFKVGAILIPKESDGVFFYRVTDVSAEVLKMVDVAKGREGDAHEVSLDDLVKNYRVHRGKITEKLPGWHPKDNACSPMVSSVWQLDVQKSAVSIALRKTYESHEQHVAHLELLQHPMMVRVSKSFITNGLKLPAASLKIDFAKKAGKDSVGVGLGLAISPHYISPVDKDGNANKAPWVAPFWFVYTGEAPKDEPANMRLVHEAVDIMGMKVNVPVLTNSKPLAAGDTLCYDKGASNDEVKEKQKEQQKPKAEQPMPAGKPQKKQRKA